MQLVLVEEQTDSSKYDNDTCPCTTVSAKKNDELNKTVSYLLPTSSREHIVRSIDGGNRFGDTTHVRDRIQYCTR